MARDWILGLAGQHQFSNAGLAAQLANCIGISEAAQRAGAAKAMWPGRLQPLSEPSWKAKIPEGGFVVARWRTQQSSSRGTQRLVEG